MIRLVVIPFGLATSRGSLLALLLIAPVLALAGLWAVTRYSRRLMIAAVVILTLIPIVGFPSHELLQPGVVGLIVIAYAALAGLLPRRRLHLTMVDAGAFVVFAGCVLSVVHGNQTKSDLEHVFFLWFCPYFAARAITGSGGRKTVLKAFAVAGAVAIPFGIVEITYGNLFLKTFPFGSEPEYGLGVPSLRLGSVRAEGAFGQPIPYAMFLAIAAIAAITLWMSRENRSSNRWLYLGLGIVAIQATALSRLGWLMLAVVAGVVIVFNFETIFSYKNRRLILLALVALGVILAFPTTNALILGSSGAESTNLEESANYRSRLIHEALQPGYINPYGTTEPQVGPLGHNSIDDEYIHAAWTWGYLPLAGFAVLFLAFLRGAWRQRRDLASLVIYATSIATMVALESVAFLTQQEVLIWLLWGCASGLTVRPVRRTFQPVERTLQLMTQRGQLAAGSEGSPRAVVT
jgi:hypothetical protein